MSFNVFQQVFSLSLASNLVKNLNGTQKSLQRTLQLGLTVALPVIGPDWRVVFGPVMWKNKPEEATTGPENSWFVAYHQKLQFEDGTVCPTYVIAIAATPPNSEYVWTKENFVVNSVADFNAWVASGIQNRPMIVPLNSVVSGTPYIATGTVNAAHLLLNTSAPAGAASEGMSLLSFISSLEVPDETRFVFTGHSLGGTLSPSVTLALVMSGAISAGSTLTYPTAGPSPGNIAFTDLFIENFPACKLIGGSSYMGWNLNLVNTLDIVPQAWCLLRRICPEQNLGNIPPIYGKPVLRFVQSLTIMFAVHALRSGTQYKPLPSQYFSGPPPEAIPTTLKKFTQIASNQHCQVYFDEVGIEIPSLDWSQVPGAKLTEKAEGEKRFNYPVIAQFEWVLEHLEVAQREIETVEGTEEAQVYRSEVDYQ